MMFPHNKLKAFINATETLKAVIKSSCKKLWKEQIPFLVHSDL